MVRKKSAHKNGITLCRLLINFLRIYITNSLEKEVRNTSKMINLVCQKDKCPFGTRLAFFDRQNFLNFRHLSGILSYLKNPPKEKWGF